MFLLSEGTLFFLDLALNARSSDEKPSLTSVVQKWVDEVAAATNSDDSAITSGASSTLYATLPVHPFTAVGQTSPTSGGCVDDGNPPQSAPVFFKTSFLADNDNVEEKKMCHFNAALPRNNFQQDVGGSPSQRSQDARRGAKRKASDTVADIIESNYGGDIEVDLADDTHQAINVPTVSFEPPPQKRARYEDTLAASLFASTEPTRGCAGFIVQLQALCGRRVNCEGYAAENIKGFSKYTTKDLPVPCDQRWSQSFLSTAILWYSTQQNAWDVPNVDLTSALQRIFNVVYPDIKYKVTPAGSVFALTLQRIHEWRSSFGSSALAMILHFFCSLDSVDEIRAAAEFLATDFRFLRADPDLSEPTEPFRSPFLLMLLAITHLGDIAAFVQVPGWDTRAMAAGESGEGVISIASAALERALILFCDGTLDVNRILAETTRRPDAPLPEAVFSTLVPPALQFSSANWSSHTSAYREAVGKRGAAFVRETFAAAQAKRRKIPGDKNFDSEVGAGMSVSGVPDPRSLL